MAVPHITPPEQTKNVTQELKKALHAHRGVFIYIGIFTAVVNLLMLTPSIYMLQVYDRVLNSRNPDTLLMITLITVMLFAIIGGLEHIRSRILIRLSAKLDEEMRDRVFGAAFENALRLRGGNPSQAFQDMNNIRQFATGNGIFAFFDAPWAPVYILVCFLLHPALGVFALVATLILLILAVLNEKLTHAPLEDANKSASLSMRYINNNLQNAEIMEAMGMLPNIRRKWAESHESMLTHQQLASARAGTLTSLSKFVRITAQSLVLGLGALLVIQDQSTPGVMIAASILMGRALAPVDQVIAVWRQFGSVRTAYQRLGGLLTNFPQAPDRMPLPAPTGKLSVENLFAAAPGSNDLIIKGVTFQISPGEVVVVVGPSASGKSTLARLLVGVWTPRNGVVRLDGADVASWDKTELGPHIGYLPQDIELFEGTIAENIARFGDIDTDEVIAATRHAGVHEMILQLPQGYDTPLGVGGSTLSGGQRQRIALARALYKTPALIVLDEPNSNLDEVGEAALVKAVLEMKAAGKTVILITHRTPIISAADKLMVMADGQLKLFGPRNAVLEALHKANQAATQQSTPPQTAGQS